MSNASQCRNFVIAGHSGSGKTILCEALLCKAGVIQRPGTLDAKNTVSDFTPEEQEKQSSIYSSVMNCTWKDTKLFGGEVAHGVFGVERSGALEHAGFAQKRLAQDGLTAAGVTGDDEVTALGSIGHF